MNKFDVLSQFAARFERGEAPARVVAELVLILGLALLLARLVWLLVAPAPQVSVLSERPMPRMLGATASGEIIRADRSTLVRLNPFISETSDIVPDAPETTLNLTLLGLRMTVEGPGSSAMVQTPNGETKMFAIGDEIIPGVSLEHIRSDRIIISRNGVSETVLRRGRGEGLSVIGDGSQTEPSPDVSGISPTERPESEASRPEGYVEDPSELFQMFSINPVERGGQIYAYRLTQRGSGEDIESTGLRNGDLLLDVNGQPVNSIKVSEMIDEIGEAQVANLLIDRNGTTQTVRLRFRE